MIRREALTKRYYSISEVASLFDVAPSLLRFWETVFTSIKPVKSERGERRYTPETILHIQEIYKLVKVEGYTLEGAKSALHDKRKRANTKQKVLGKLNRIRKDLDGLITD